MFFYSVLSHLFNINSLIEYTPASFSIKPNLDNLVKYLLKEPDLRCTFLDRSTLLIGSSRSAIMISFSLLDNLTQMINIINGQNGAFGGRMLQFNVDPFSKEHTKEYLNKYISNLSFTEEGFKRFYSCTRGIPAYINSLASIL